MDKVLVTTLLTIAAVVAAVMVINTMLPALGSGGSSVLSSSSVASSQIKTNVDIIAVSTNTTTPAVYVWVKNVGATDVLAIDKSDVFLQTPTDYIRMSYNETPGWVYIIENGTVWKPGNTVKVTITLTSLAEGEYVVKFTTNNGVSDEESFSV